MRVPSYRKHASGQARVTLAGKDYLLGPYGSKASRNKYVRLLAEYQSSEESKSFGAPPDSLTITELLAAYRKHSKRYYGTGAGSELHRLKPVMQAMKTLYGTELAASFGPKQFKAVRQKMMNEGDRTRSYINSQMKKIKRMFIWAAGEGLLSASISEALKAVDPLKLGRTTLREAEPIKPVDAAKVLATLPNLPPVVRSMVEFQQLLGCRPGEVCSIKPSMVDRATDVWEIHLDRHKTAWRGIRRVLYVGQKAQAILMPLLLRDPDDFCFKPSDSEKKRLEERHEARTTPMNQGNVPGSCRKRRRKLGLGRKPARLPGESYTAASYGRAISRACDKSFPPPKDRKLNAKELSAWRKAHRWAPNQLRHSYATQVRKSDGLEAASIMLGHAGIGVTQLYAEANIAQAREIARRIG